MEHYLKPLILPLTLTEVNVRQVKNQLILIFKLIYHKVCLEQRKIKQDQIQQNIKLRCYNYDEDPTKMIDSILNREWWCIVLNHLVYKDPVLGNILITDTQTIQQHAVLYFQQYALSQTAPPQMNKRWTTQFTPKQYVNDEWFHSIIVPSTWDEWNNTIKSLPNDKVCGLSSLHNEFFRHAGKSLQLLTWKLTKMCFQLGFIPDEWK